jgi:hypothetical protein
MSGRRTEDDKATVLVQSDHMRCGRPRRTAVRVFMASVTKTGEKRWGIDFRDENDKRVKRVVGTKREAELAAADLKLKKY